MNNQTEEIDIPGFKYQTVEVSKKDLVRLKEGWSKLKINEPRKYYECLESLKEGVIKNRRDYRANYGEADFLSSIPEDELQIIVVDAMVKRVVDHIENGEQLIKKVN